MKKSPRQKRCLKSQNGTLKHQNGALNHQNGTLNYQNTENVEKLKTSPKPDAKQIRKNIRKLKTCRKTANCDKHIQTTYCSSCSTI